MENRKDQNLKLKSNELINDPGNNNKNIYIYYIKSQ